MADVAERLLKDGERVPFVAYAPSKGVSEFRFCLRYRRGKLIEVLIHHLQGAARYRLEIGHRFPSERSFSANAWTHKGLSAPWTWRHFWCEDHKCPAFDLYVPREAEWFEVAHGDIYFGRDDPALLRERRDGC